MDNASGERKAGATNVEFLKGNIESIAQLEQEFIGANRSFSQNEDGLESVHVPINVIDVPAHTEPTRDLDQLRSFLASAGSAAARVRARPALPSSVSRSSTTERLPRL